MLNTEDMAPAIAHSGVGMAWLRRYLAAIGVAAILGALASLAVPVHLDAADRHGRSLPCGSAMRPDHGTVAAEDQLNQHLHQQDIGKYHSTDYLGECAQWIFDKRQAALYVGLAGALTLAATELLVRAPRTRRRSTTDSRSGPPHPV